MTRLPQAFGGAGAFLARWRVFLGFVFAAVTLWIATPTRTSFVTGTVVVTLGELLRVWAAGHVEKSTEVTRSGPYRFVRHPLYLGSSLIGIGFAAASRHWIVAAVVVLYLALTLTSAMVREEAHLRNKFGDAYDAYVEKRSEPMTRRFSWARALRNREHHTMMGLGAAFLLLWMKVVS